MTAHLVTVGHHVPKKFPHSPEELLGKRKTPAPFNKEQWRAAISEILAGNNERVKREAAPPVATT